MVMPVEQLEERSTQHGHLYFRVGIFGKALTLGSITNKYFLYKHPTYEMLSNIQSLLLNKLSTTMPIADYHNQTLSNMETHNSSVIYKTSLLHHNQMPDMSVQNDPDICALQICAVNRLENWKLVDLIDEMVESKETVAMKDELLKLDRNLGLYYFDRPFYRQDLKIIENLWIERSLLLVDYEGSIRFENMCQYEEVRSVFKILLSPIRNAINDIDEKTRELKAFIVQFKVDSEVKINSQFSIMQSLQPLTMRLLGCLDARVNGGLIKYVKELFSQSLVTSKQFRKKSYLMNQFYTSVKDQLCVLESGLSIHERNLQRAQIAESKGDNTENENVLENLKHMNQLNEHLTECLRHIEHELNERWNSLSAFYRQN